MRRLAAKMRSGSSKRMTSWMLHQIDDVGLSRLSDSSSCSAAAFFVRPSIFVIRKAFCAIAVLQRLAHAALALALVVVPAVVQEVHAVVERRPDDAECLGFILLPACMESAEPDKRDLLAGLSECPVRHLSLCLRRLDARGQCTGDSDLQEIAAGQHGVFLFAKGSSSTRAPGEQASRLTLAMTRGRCQKAGFGIRDFRLKAGSTYGGGKAEATTAVERRKLRRRWKGGSYDGGGKAEATTAVERRKLRRRWKGGSYERRWEGGSYEDGVSSGCGFRL